MTMVVGPFSPALGAPAPGREEEEDLDADESDQDVVATIDGDDHLLPLRDPAALGQLVEKFPRRLSRRNSRRRDQFVDPRSSDL